MNPKRKKKLILILLLVGGIGVAAALALFALRENINLFFTPSEVVEGKAPADHAFRLGGLVKVGSVERAKEGLKVRFILTDTAKEVTVVYEGILPDLFREGQGIVATGKMGAEGAFVAEEVLAKHDENYMPPEVKGAIESAQAKGTMPHGVKGGEK